MPEFIDKNEGKDLFGTDPQNYDEIRPPYPEDIYEFLLTTGALHVNTSTLEIGAGNGLATRRFLALGASPLTILEPDQRFFPLLRSIAGLYKVEIQYVFTSFEEAVLPYHHYDFVAAATSFHWIQSSIGLTKVAKLLKPGGYVALWWHVFGDAGQSDPYHEATRDLLQPLSASPSSGEDTLPFALDTRTRLRDFSSTGQFEEPEYRLYRWTLILNTAQVGSLYATFSPISRLPQEQRKAVLDQLMEIADRQFGGMVERKMLSPIYVAKREATGT